MIKMIAAVSENGVMGKDNKLPWSKRYPSDLKRFKALTTGSSIVMGSKTWESIGKRCLPNRAHYIVTSRMDDYAAEGIAVCSSPKAAIELAIQQSPGGNVWICGGAAIYQQTMDLVQEIDLTIVPEVLDQKDAVLFPWINPVRFKMEEMTPGEDGLLHILYSARSK